MKAFGTKRVSLILQLVVAAFALLASTQNWITFGLSEDTAASSRVLEVSGNAMAPMVFALLLAVLAGIGALSIANRGLSYVVLSAVVACSVGSTVICVSVASEPILFAQSQLTAATGISGVNSLDSYVVSVIVSPWVSVTAFAAGSLALLGLISIANVHKWVRRRTRFDSDVIGATESSQLADQRAKRAGVDDLADDRITDWDALSNGDDPS